MKTCFRFLQFLRKSCMIMMRLSRHSSTLSASMVCSSETRRMICARMILALWTVPSPEILIFLSQCPSTTAMSLLRQSASKGLMILNYFRSFCRPRYTFSLVKTRLTEEQKKFFTPLSVLPGRNTAIWDHLLPTRVWASKSVSCSAWLHSSLTMSGLSWCCHLSRHCLPVRNLPVICWSSLETSIHLKRCSEKEDMMRRMMLSSSGVHPLLEALEVQPVTALSYILLIIIFSSACYAPFLWSLRPEILAFTGTRKSSPLPQYWSKLMEITLEWTFQISQKSTEQGILLSSDTRCRPQQLKVPQTGHVLNGDQAKPTLMGC